MTLTPDPPLCLHCFARAVVRYITVAVDSVAPRPRQAEAFVRRYEWQCTAAENHYGSWTKAVDSNEDELVTSIPRWAR